MSSGMDFSIDPGTAIGAGVGFVVFLVVYFFFLIRALLEMIRLDAPGVVVVFTYLSLIPLPPLLILGFANLVIWHCLRGDLMAKRAPG